MWLYSVIGIPLFIVLIIFVLTSRKSIKKKLIRLGTVTLIMFSVIVVLDPSVVGIRWIRTKWSNYEVPSEFMFTIRSGVFGKDVRGINLKSEEPVYTVINDYSYEIYTGDYIYEGVSMVEDAYKGYDAIGVAVYEEDELICKWILPSIISVDSLELVDENPITLRVHTEEFSYEYIVEVTRMGTYENGDESYYEIINEKPAREYYIPFNQGWVDRSETDE